MTLQRRLERLEILETGARSPAMCHTGRQG